MLLGIVRSGCRRGHLINKQLANEQKAGIKSLAARGEPFQRPPPFPYKKKQYNALRAFIDKTSWRFDENTKVIVVEGPIASGKTEFAKELAKQLDMLYIRRVTMDDLYINSYGYDYRQLDSQLPLNAQSCDEKKFLENPNNINVASFQVRMLQLKYSQYIDAICHLMNSGQGVVLERSCFTDHVFLEAMYNAGYVSKVARDVYHTIKRHTVPQLIKPHLVIYLDVPVPKIQENIQKRSIQYEVKSKVLTPKYLGDIEKYYKELALPELEIHSELMVCDWSKGGDVETVVEDIERIDFDRFEKNDKKLKEWRFRKEWDLCEERIMYTTQKDMFMGYFNIPRFDAPELMLSGDDVKAFNDAYFNSPGNRYEAGYNEDMGDKNVLLKVRRPARESVWV